MANKMIKKVNKNAKKIQKKYGKWEKKNPAAALALKVVPVAGGVASKVYYKKKMDKRIDEIYAAAGLTKVEEKKPSLISKIKGILPGKKETAPAPAPAPEGAQNAA